MWTMFFRPGISDNPALTNVDQGWVANPRRGWRQSLVSLLHHVVLVSLKKMFVDKGKKTPSPLLKWWYRDTPKSWMVYNVYNGKSEFRNPPICWWCRCCGFGRRKNPTKSPTTLLLGRTSLTAATDLFSLLQGRGREDERIEFLLFDFGHLPLLQIWLINAYHMIFLWFAMENCHL